MKVKWQQAAMSNVYMKQPCKLICQSFFKVLKCVTKECRIWWWQKHQTAIARGLFCIAAGITHFM